MSIPFNLKIKPTAKTVRIDTPLKDNHTEWVAWWYGGIYKNRKANSQPNVIVGFREIFDGAVSDEVICRYIPLTALGQVTVGSIWKDGVCRSGVDFTVQDFDIDFRSDGWQLTSFQHAFKNNLEQPYPLEIHALQYPGDKNWLLQFRLPSGGKLVVPCLEFFSRCYGRSQEINRILASYPWEGNEDSCLSKFYARLDEPEELNKWKVKLRKRLRNGDTTFLAHAKYDRYTRDQAKLIHSQIERDYKPESKSPIFIQVAPWFRGPAEIRVRGIWFDNNRSFLALQVMGCSDPDGILIERDRENANNRDGGAGDESNADGNAWSGVPEKKLIRPPDIVDLTGDAEPDHGANSVELLDQDFVVMGIPRAIVDRHGIKITSSSGARRKGDEASAYSSGEPHGSGKNVGFATIHAKPVIESHGALMDMWNAMLHIQKKHPDKVQSVEWFTFEDGYKSQTRPNLIALDPIDEDDNTAITTKTKSWVYYNVATGRVRGVMVVRLLVDGTPIYIIELQRKHLKVKDEGAQEKDGEQSFKGFITVIEDNDEFIRWLKRFLSDVRYIRGIVQKLTPYAPEKSDTFSHKKAGYEKVPCEAAVLKALSKIGVVL